VPTSSAKIGAMPRARKPQTIEEYKAWFASLGGKASQANKTPEQRRVLASEAASARWKKTSKAERRKAALKAIRARWARVKARTK